MHKLKDVILLMVRLNLGMLFVGTGWGKVHSLPELTAFFADLHIPWPALNAVLVGYTELFCGLLLILGLATRLAAVPLSICMVVAILTAKLPMITDLSDLMSTGELTYALALCVIAVVGPGRTAFDALVYPRLPQLRLPCLRQFFSPGELHA